MLFRVLGPVEVTAGGAAPVVPRRRERCLLAILLLRLGEVTPRDRLVELLWDGDPPDGAWHTLPSHVSRVRSLIATVGAADRGFEIAPAAGGYQLTGDPQLVDAHQFRSLVVGSSTLDDPHERADQLRVALDLWRGPPMANAASNWLRGQLCLDLEEWHLTAVERLAAAQIALGRGGEILPALAKAVGTHPGHERLVALQMQALHQAGRKADALAAYTQAGSYLAQELGLDPGPALREAHLAVLRDQVPASPAPPRQPAPAAAPAPPTPRQLPAAVAGFAGRTADLRTLDALLPVEDAGDGRARIATIAGTGGVGKTALAVSWAHRVADRFPDGQLYVNLGGFGAAAGEPDPHHRGAPVAPAHALRGFLEALGVPPERVPTTVEAQVGQYRSLLAGRRMLILLDNARDAGQVRPLLPGTSGCLVVVTSRNQLCSLVVAEGARPLALDLLTHDEARELLVRRLGADRVAAEPAAVNEIISWCARLPLALAVVAARAAIRPGFPLPALAKELADTGEGLDAWSDPGSSTDMRTVFSWSYRALGPEAARLFRLLGLHPGPEIALPVAVSLAGGAAPRVRRMLVELTRAHLLTEHAPGRYSCHDLLRAYAAELARTDPLPDRQAATRRLLDHYLHTAHQSARLLNPYRRPIPLAPPEPGVTPTVLSTPDDALGWLAAELPALVAAVGLAGGAGLDDRAWQLSWALSEYLDRQARWQDLLVTQRLALDAARRLADPEKEAAAHRGLGITFRKQGRYPAAHRHLRRARDLFRVSGQPLNQATVHVGLGMTHERQGRYRAALHHARLALDLYRAAGHRGGEANSLNGIGWLHARIGEHQRSLAYCRQALAIHRELGSRAGEADAHDSLGFAYHGLGQHARAFDCYERAIALLHETSKPYAAADSLVRLGDVHHASGDHHAARTAWQRALGILMEIGHPDADGVRDRLQELPVPESG